MQHKFIWFSFDTALCILGLGCFFSGNHQKQINEKKSLLQKEKKIQNRTLVLMKEVAAMRARSNMGKLCWDDHGLLKPVQNYSEDDLKVLRDSKDPESIDGILYREGLDFVSDDDREVAEYLNSIGLRP